MVSYRKVDTALDEDEEQPTIKVYDLEQNRVDDMTVRWNKLWKPTLVLSGIFYLVLVLASYTMGPSPVANPSSSSSASMNSATPTPVEDLSCSVAAIENERRLEGLETCSAYRNPKEGDVPFHEEIQRSAEHPRFYDHTSYLFSDDRASVYVKIPYVLSDYQQKHVVDSLGGADQITKVFAHQLDSFDFVRDQVNAFAFSMEPTKHFLIQYKRNCVVCDAEEFERYVEGSLEHSRQVIMDHSAHLNDSLVVVDVPQSFWFQEMPFVLPLKALALDTCADADWEFVYKLLSGHVSPVDTQSMAETCEDSTVDALFDDIPGNKLKDVTLRKICKIRWMDYFCLGYKLPAVCSDSNGFYNVNEFNKNNEKLTL